MEDEIKQAVALLMKNGFEAREISSTMKARDVTTISLVLSILGEPRNTYLHKSTFENAWFQKSSGLRTVA